MDRLLLNHCTDICFLHRTCVKTAFDSDGFSTTATVQGVAFGLDVLGFTRINCRMPRPTQTSRYAHPLTESGERPFRPYPSTHLPIHRNADGRR
jgi:hypothetical protein